MKINLKPFELAKFSKFKKYPVPAKKSKPSFKNIGYGKINDLFIAPDYSILPTWEELIIEHKKGSLSEKDQAKYWIKNPLEVPSSLILNTKERRHDRIIVGVFSEWLQGDLDFVYVQHDSDAFFLQKI